MSIGEPLPRPDGPAKVTGAARYAADYAAPGLLRAVLVTAPIPAGRIAGIDAGKAIREPDVVRVLTHEDMPEFGALDGPPSAQSFMPMQSDEIRHEGQPVAMVLGETLEAAEAGAQRVEVRYARGEARLPVPATWNTLAATAVVPRATGFLFLPPDFEKSARGAPAAATRVEAIYFQPWRHHNAIEPSAVLAAWDGDSLIVHDSTQHVYGVQKVLAARLKLPLDRI